MELTTRRHHNSDVTFRGDIIAAGYDDSGDDVVESELVLVQPAKGGANLALILRVNGVRTVESVDLVDLANQPLHLGRSEQEVLDQICARALNPRRHHNYYQGNPMPTAYIQPDDRVEITGPVDYDPAPTVGAQGTVTHVLFRATAHEQVSVKLDDTTSVLLTPGDAYRVLR